jgi:hypothetical protein
VVYWSLEKEGFLINLFVLIFWVRRKDRGKGLWHDIGYVASYVQLWAATIFWISTLLVCTPPFFLATLVESQEGDEPLTSPERGMVTNSTGLPGVIRGFPDDPPVAITDVFFWTPQGEEGFTPKRFFSSWVRKRVYNG